MVSEGLQRRIDKLLEDASEAMATSDWAIVVNCADNVLRIDPDNEEARAYLDAFERDRDSATEKNSPP
jgi:hypothetical protein